MEIYYNDIFLTMLNFSAASFLPSDSAIIALLVEKLGGVDTSLDHSPLVARAAEAKGEVSVTSGSARQGREVGDV